MATAHLVFHWHTVYEFTTKGRNFRRAEFSEDWNYERPNDSEGRILKSQITEKAELLKRPKLKAKFLKGWNIFFSILGFFPPSIKKINLKARRFGIYVSHLFLSGPNIHILSCYCERRGITLPTTRDSQCDMIEGKVVRLLTLWVSNS